MNSLGALLRNWREYDASLRQRGSLTVRFTDEAVQGWRAAPRTTPGGQSWHSPLAIFTALTLSSLAEGLKSHEAVSRRGGHRQV